MSKIFPWRDGLEPPKGEMADRYLAKNFETIAQGMDKTGLYLAGSASVKTVQTTTSTSYIDVADLKLSVNLSGGLVVVYGLVHMDISNDYAICQLLEGSTQLDEDGFVGSATSSLRANLFWIGSKPAGQYTFKVQAKSKNGNTLTLNQIAGASYSIASKLYVLEYLKG